MRASWASARATSSPWPARSMRTGSRARCAASQDSSLATTSRWSSLCRAKPPGWWDRRNDGEQRKERRKEGTDWEFLQRGMSAPELWHFDLLWRNFFFSHSRRRKEGPVTNDWLDRFSPRMKGLTDKRDFNALWESNISLDWWLNATVWFQNLSLPHFTRVWQHWLQ